MAEPAPGDTAAGPAEWAERFAVQAAACEELGSPLYARLLVLLADLVSAGGPTWEVIAPHAGLRFGQAGPLRLVGVAHRLALAGEAPAWASLLPSCGGTVPGSDVVLAESWDALVDEHAAELSAGMTREVQTNEVGRAAGLSLALAESAVAAAGEVCRLVEIGCSAGLNLRLDHFAVDLGGLVLGDAASAVQLQPEMRAPLGAHRHEGLVLPRVGERVGIDPHPLDAATEAGRLTLLSFVWPDQSERLARVEAAIELARRHPAELMAVATQGRPDTAAVLAGVLERPGPAVVQHSIMWQYVPTAVRWQITDVLEEAGQRATTEAPLAWVRYEPDEWNRTRAAVWLRTWPAGGDRLVAHVDYHGRWLEPLPT